MYINPVIQSSSVVAWGREESRSKDKNREVTSGLWKNLGCEEYIHYFDYADVLQVYNICQNLT